MVLFSTISSLVIADFSRALGSCLGLSIERSLVKISACRVRVILSWVLSYPSTWLRFEMGILVTLDVSSHNFFVYRQLYIWCSMVSGRWHLGHSSVSVNPNFFNLVPQYMSPCIDLNIIVLSLVLVSLFIRFPNLFNFSGTGLIIIFGSGGFVCFS